MPKIETIKSKDVLTLLKSQQYLCSLTGRKLTPKSASLDHIIPLAQGGDHTIENIWIVDHQANAAKGTMTADEFIRLCEEVAAHQQRRTTTQMPERVAVPSRQ